MLICVFRARQDITPAGEALLADMERHGVSREELIRCRHAMNVQIQRAAHEAAPSRAGFLSVVGAAFDSAGLPEEKNWEVLIVGSYRTMASLKSAKTRILTFATAQLAGAAIGGRDVGHLYESGSEEPGGKVR